MPRGVDPWSAAGPLASLCDLGQSCAKGWRGASRRELIRLNVRKIECEEIGDARFRRMMTCSAHPRASDAAETHGAAPAAWTRQCDGAGGLQHGRRRYL